MALPATDTFTTDTDQTLTAYSSNWSANHNDLDVDSTNDVVASSQGINDEGVCHWSADTFNDDQYCDLELIVLDGASSIGPMVRVATNGDQTGYLFESSANNSFFYKVVTGTYTQLAADTAAGSANEVYRIEAEGTTITALVDDVQEQQETDSSISSGAAGIHGWHSTTGTGSDGDNWEGGNLGAAATGFMTTNRGYWGP